MTLQTQKHILRTRAKDLDLSVKVHLMGILNVTPDSFSDGGNYLEPKAAIARAEQMIEEGVDIIDVGGESTRPGAAPVSEDVERERVLPVVEVLAQRFPQVPISVDTSKASVARQCLEEGASMINDVYALKRDPALADAVKDHGVPVVIAHMLGTPQDMQKHPTYKNVIDEVTAFLKGRAAELEAAGIARENIVVDPGIGFGKTLAHNLELLRSIGVFMRLGYPLLVGTSRKSFIGKILGSEEAPAPVEERGGASIAVDLWSAAQGARLLRVHDVGGTRRALKAWDALVRGGRAGNK